MKRGIFQRAEANAEAENSTVNPSTRQPEPVKYSIEEWRLSVSWRECRAAASVFVER